MSETWKPAIRIWPFADAPDEFRALSPFGGGEEVVIYVPPELVDEDGLLLTETPALSFLEWVVKIRVRPRVMYAGACWGSYWLHEQPDRSLVAVLAGSDKGWGGYSYRVWGS
jgi:hypothetical protein